MLFKKNRYLNLKRVRSFADLPAPKKNEVLVATQDDRLLECGMPTMNRGNRVAWWSLLPNSAGSYRRCHGINDLMSYGFTIASWCDFEIQNRHGEIRVIPSERQFMVEAFSFDQVGECPITHDREIPDMSFPKFVAPFFIRTAPGWSLMTFQHPLLYSRDFQLMPGMIHTDFYHNINVVLNVLGNGNFVIPAGTPLLYCLPVERKNLGQVTDIQHADNEVAMVMVHHGLGYSGIQRSDAMRKHLYRQRLRDADN